MLDRSIRPTAWRRLSLTLLPLLFLTAAPLAAQNFVVGDVAIPEIGWGNQTIRMEITNRTDYVKFVVAEAEIQFDGEYLHPQRRIRSFHAFPPQETQTVDVSLLVPGNFGKADAQVRLYDVVDTLDEVLPGQKFFEQPFLLQFRVPESMQAYVDARITLPPRVNSHPYFDSEFARVLFVLLGEGKGVAEIAAMAECDSSFVEAQIELLIIENYARRTPEGVKLTVPVIREAEASAARELAIKMADSLTATIAKNLPQLGRARDSLIAAGVMASDSRAFYDPGTVLFHEHATIGALVLWWELGREFITRAAPLMIYDGTDLCNADIPTYMYVVEGGPVVNGEHFYAPQPGPVGLSIRFGDTIPTYDCGPDFIRHKSYPSLIRPEIDPAFSPLSYMVDTSVVRPAIDAVTAGLGPLLESTYTTLRDMAVDSYGHERLDYGYRYWFWNLVATRTLDALVAGGSIEREQNGQYIISGMEFRP